MKQEELGVARSSAGRSAALRVEPPAASQAKPAATNAERQARCAHCQRLEPSSDRLPFFESRGEGSKQATEACRVCKCYEIAHHPRGDDAPEAFRGKIPTVIGKPHPFEPHGPWEFDLFYCGCRGWD